MVRLKKIIAVLLPFFVLLRIRWCQSRASPMTLVVMFTRQPYAPNFWPLPSSLKLSNRFHFYV